MSKTDYQAKYIRLLEKTNAEQAAIIKHLLKSGTGAPSAPKKDKKHKATSTGSHHDRPIKAAGSDDDIMQKLLKEIKAI